MTARGASTRARGRAPAPRTIVCWRIELDQSEDRVAVLAEVLSPDERERADRFVVDRRRGSSAPRSCAPPPRPLSLNRVDVDHEVEA